VIGGSGVCNEAMLTGESRPVPKSVGKKIFGGSILNEGVVVARVLKTSEFSSLNQIIKLVENAQSSKAPIQSVADNISMVFVPIIVLLAILTWFIWFPISFAVIMKV
jgi:Cu+-exporting ATPase